MSVRLSYPMRGLFAGVVLVGLFTSPIAAQGEYRSAPSAATDDERLRARRADRALDGAQYAVRRHAHRRDEPGDRRCRRRPAARGPDRRQGPGTVSLIVWGANDRRQHDVVVDPGVTTLQQTFQKLFPGEDIRVAMNEESIILTGNLEQRHHAARWRDRGRHVGKTGVSTCCSFPAAREPAGHAAGPRGGGQPPRHQGARRQLLCTRPEWAGRVTTQQFSAPDFDDDKLVFSDFLNLFFFNRKEASGAVIKALEQKACSSRSPSRT